MWVYGGTDFDNEDIPGYQKLNDSTGSTGAGWKQSAIENPTEQDFLVDSVHPNSNQSSSSEPWPQEHSKK